MLHFENQILLIVAPHPDDEVLGCGGLIQKIKEAGGKVYVLFMTVGDTKEYSQNGHSTIGERRKEIENVAKFLDYNDYDIAFEGNSFHLRLDTVAQKDIIEKIENASRVAINKITPTLIATPYLNDYNQDHRSTTRAIFSACRPAPSDSKPLQNTIIGYECVSVADWWDAPRSINMYLPLSDDTLEKKLSALRLYRSQIRHGYHARSLHSIKTLAYFRGLYIGAKAAEAFYIYRSIVYV